MLVVTGCLQAVVVALSGSVALLSDTLHNLSDALTALPLWLALSLGRRPRDRRLTYGYGRGEDLAGIFVVLAIAASGAFAAYESVDRLFDPQPIDRLGLVATASLIGFFGNEFVAVYRIRVGRQIGSAALVADGLHARVDGLTSLGVLAGSLGVAAGFHLADPLIGLVIALAILTILRAAARDIFYRLMDAVDPTLVDRVEAVLASVEGVEEVEDVRIRWIGHELHAEVQIAVDPLMTVAEGHAVAVRGHHALLHAVDRLSSATVHVDPASPSWHDHHAEIAHHFR